MNEYHNSLRKRKETVFDSGSSQCAVSVRGKATPRLGERLLRTIHANESSGERSELTDRGMNTFGLAEKSASNVQTMMP